MLQLPLYGHVINLCSRQLVCVRCAGSHQTKECESDDRSAMKCGNCGEPRHSATLKRCLQHKNFSIRRRNLHCPEESSRAALLQTFSTEGARRKHKLLRHHPSSRIRSSRRTRRRHHSRDAADVCRLQKKNAGQIYAIDVLFQSKMPRCSLLLWGNHA